MYNCIHILSKSDQFSDFSEMIVNRLRRLLKEFFLKSIFCTIWRLKSIFCRKWIAIVVRFNRLLVNRLPSLNFAHLSILKWHLILYLLFNSKNICIFIFLAGEVWRVTFSVVHSCLGLYLVRIAIYSIKWGTWWILKNEIEVKTDKNLVSNWTNQTGPETFWPNYQRQNTHRVKVVIF